MHGSPEAYPVTDSSACAFDLSGWHDDPGCTCIVFAASGHTHGVIFCTTCKVAADIEAAGNRITHEVAGLSLAEAAKKAKEGR